MVIDLLNLILELDPSILGPVDGSKLMGDILIDMLDIDLAISEVDFFKLRYESSTLILYKELSSSIFQSCQSVSE